MKRPRLGKSQLQTLAAIAVPSHLLVTPSESDLRLVEFGYAQHVSDEGKSICVTVAGLRRLADELEAGRVKDGRTLAAERRASTN